MPGTKLSPGLREVPLQESEEERYRYGAMCEPNCHWGDLYNNATATARQPQPSSDGPKSDGREVDEDGQKLNDVRIPFAAPSPVPGSVHVTDTGQSPWVTRRHRLTAMTSSALRNFTGNCQVTPLLLPLEGQVRVYKLSKRSQDFFSFIHSNRTNFHSRIHNQTQDFQSQTKQHLSQWIPSSMFTPCPHSPSLPCH